MVISLTRSRVTSIGESVSHAGLEAARRLVPHLPNRGRHGVCRVASGVFGKYASTCDATIAGYRVSLSTRDDMQRQMIFGIYDQILTGFVQSILQPGDVFYDLGANVGYYSLLASRLIGPTGQVHAFEPIPENAALLRTAVRTNRIENVIVNQVAIGAEDGKITLHVGDVASHSGWASIVESDKRPNEVQASVTSIDTYLKGDNVRRPTIIKMDIEGAEPDAIAGMQALLKADDAPALIVEINPFLLERSGRDPSAILDPLIGAGYELFEITDHGLEDVPTAFNDDQLYDVFCTRFPAMHRTVRQ